jgi:thioredoxin-related protein
MKLITFNALMWLNRPTVRTVIIGIALLLVTTYASAFELINIHSDSCSYCQKFQREVGDSGYNANPISVTVPMVTVNVGNDLPQWLTQALDEGRIHQIRYTPTFILVDEDYNEVGRFAGYHSPEWFFEKVNSIYSDYISPQ